MPVKRGFRVRLMSPLGRYPAESFYNDSSALVISPDVCFSVIRMAKEDLSFGELDILQVNELPLYGSILLAGEAGTPYLFPYPSTYSVTLETETEQLEEINEQLILECKSFLLENTRTTEPYPSAAFHKPPCEGGMKYDLVPWRSSANSDRLAIFRNLQISNPVILRGVNCMLKARMAYQHHELAEAACIYLWVALDAAHSLMLKRLREMGMVNPTSKDAARYFEKISGFETEWEKFFEEDYNNRVLLPAKTGHLI